MGPSPWKRMFCEWPQEMPRRGVLVTTFQEQIPFDGFLLSDDLLLVERQSPDTLGSRAVVVPFDQVAAVKIVDVLKPKALRAVGFEGIVTKR